MSEPSPIGAAAPSPQVHAAIARAARATGNDFAYLLGEARLESSLNPQARASTSSAAGLYQFTGQTWLQTLDRHGAEHGLDWASAAISGGRVQNPAQRGTIMDLRYDPDAAALMAGALTNDNRTALTTALDRAPDHGELYLAHFLGAEGASRFLRALAANPVQAAAGLFPEAASANHAIFYSPAGAPRSLGEVKALIGGKLARAMGDQPMGVGPLGEWSSFVPSAATRPGSTPPHNSVPPPPARLSMADTLAATFGTGADRQIPPQVRAAYGKLQAFGL